MRMKKHPAWGLVWATTALLLTTSSHAQEDSTLFFDTVDVNVRNIEVLVTDSEGQPVTGLSIDDFELIEDGQPVEITNFFSVVDRQTILPDQLVGVDQEELLPEPETRRLNLVVFVDDLNTRPENRNQHLQSLRSYIEGKLQPDDRMMLVTLSSKVEVVVPFSNDKQRLLDALEKMKKVVGPSLMVESEMRRLLSQLTAASMRRSDAGRDFDQDKIAAESLTAQIRTVTQQRYAQVRGTAQAIETFVDSMAGMPGRKAVLYVSDGLPESPGAALAQAWVNKFENWVFDQGITDLTDDLREMTRLSAGAPDFDTRRFIRDLGEAAAARQVAFYPIAAQNRLLNPFSAEWTGAGTANGNRPTSHEVSTLETISRESSLLNLAADTGGVAFTRSTNLEGLLDRMEQDFRTFYSLGFSPTGEEGELKSIEVKVRRDDLVVRHFKGYQKRDPMAQLQDMTLSAVYYGADANELELQLEPGKASPTENGRYRLSVMVKIPFSRLLLLPEEEFHTGQVTLFVTVRDENNGGLSPFQRIELPIKIPNDRVFEALGQTAAYPLELEIDGGLKRIAVGARDHLGQVDATAHVELTVGES